MKKYIIILFIIIFNISIVNGVDVNKGKFTYEINSITKQKDGFLIKGWGLTVQEHHHTKDSHNYELQLFNNKERLIYKSKALSLDQSMNMRIQGVRRCYNNEFNAKDYCYYDYKYSGFEFYVPYKDIKEGFSYDTKLVINNIPTKKSHSIRLYYPFKSVITHKIDQNYISANSNLYTNKLKIAYSDIFLRNTIGSSSFMYSGNYCSYGNRNILFYKENSIYNKIYDQKLVNNTTFYNVKSNLLGCYNGKSLVSEGTKFNSWIPSNFVDFEGKNLTFENKFINAKPRLYIKSNPTVNVNQEIKIKDFAYAIDDEEGDLTHKITPSTLSFAKKGVYEVNLRVEDKYKYFDTKAIKITAINPNDKYPVINADDKTIYVNDEFNPKNNVSAFDNEDGDLTSKIKIDGNVNNLLVGEYKIKYSVTDSDDKTTIKEITVSVIDKPITKLRFINRKFLFYKQVIPINWKSKMTLLETILNNKVYFKKNTLS